MNLYPWAWYQRQAYGEGVFPGLGESRLVETCLDKLNLLQVWLPGLRSLTCRLVALVGRLREKTLAERQLAETCFDKLSPRQDWLSGHRAGTCRLVVLVGRLREKLSPGVPRAE